MQQHAAAPALDAELARKMDAYWRAANYLSVGQIYLCDNPLLREPLALAHVKRMLLGHWGTTPGQNFIYTHLNRVIKKYDVDMIYMSGPGHGGPAVVGNTYLEGTYSEIYANVSEDEAGLKRLFTQFSFPGGIPSHASAECPGSIHEGGELGYSLSHAFGAVFDNPELVVACVVGDGEAETGPLATSWHSNKFLNPASDGAVLPILHLNGYKIANPTILARISREELQQLLQGYGWTPHFVEGHEPMPMHEAMAAALDTAMEEIRRIQADARLRGRTERPRWPMIVLASPKGWTGPKIVDGKPNEGTFRSHQVPLSDPAKNPEHLRQLESWLRSYRPEELFGGDGRLLPELKALAPSGARRMGANPHANGGMLLRDLRMPDFTEHAVDVPQPGMPGIGDTHVVGRFLRDVVKLPHFRTGRNAVERPRGGVRDDQSPMAGRHRRQRRVPGTHRPSHGDVERAPMRGLARGVPAHRPAWAVQLLRGFHSYRRLDVQSTCEMAESNRGPRVAAQDRLAQLPAEFARLAAGSQRVHAPRSRFPRPCGQQKSGNRARLSAAGRQLPAVGHGPLPAQPALRQCGGGGQAPGAAMAVHGCGDQALQRGNRNLAMGQQ
jgi:hypothetical protein